MGKLDPVVALSCTRLSVFIGGFMTCVYLVYLPVMAGNESLTANVLAFGILMIVFCLPCAMSGGFAIRPSVTTAVLRRRALDLFSGLNILIFATVAIFFIVDLADSGCMKNVLRLSKCKPGDTQNAFPMVLIYFFVLIGLFFSFLSGRNLRNIADKNTRRGRGSVDLEGLIITPFNALWADFCCPKRQFVMDDGEDDSDGDVVSLHSTSSAGTRSVPRDTDFAHI